MERLITNTTPIGAEETARSLAAAQAKAQALFDATIESGLIREGVLESEITAGVHALARSRFGLRRHWHKRIARSGPNTLLTYGEESSDRRLTGDDIVYLDFGPVFGEWEADFGRTYVVGSDPTKHRLVADLTTAFARGKALFDATPLLTAGQLYDHVVELGAAAGWQFGAATAGHLIGQFPHERPPRDPRRFQIRHGNEQLLREPDARGLPRHWILEIHFVDRGLAIGGFLEELLTV